jgi:hypothetical protein
MRVVVGNLIPLMLYHFVYFVDPYATQGKCECFG